MPHLAVNHMPTRGSTSGPKEIPKHAKLPKTKGHFNHSPVKVPKLFWFKYIFYIIFVIIILIMKRVLVTLLPILCAAMKDFSEYSKEE